MHEPIDRSLLGDAVSVTRYNSLRRFFGHLITLSIEEDVVFFVDGEQWDGVFIDGIEMGLKSGNTRLLFCGDCEDEDGKTVIDTPVRDIVDRIELMKRYNIEEIYYD